VANKTARSCLHINSRLLAISKIGSIDNNARRKIVFSCVRPPQSNREKEFVASVHALHRRLGMTQKFREGFADLIHSYLDLDHVEGHIGPSVHRTHVH
jgi:hypothetical protein